MTVKYDHPEVERLIAEARTEVSRRRTAPRCDSCGGLIMHRSEYWIAAIADQLEAARMEIDRLGHAARAELAALRTWAAARSRRHEAAERVAALNVRCPERPDDAPEIAAWKAAERAELVAGDELYEIVQRTQEG